MVLVSLFGLLISFFLAAHPPWSPFSFYLFQSFFILCCRKEILLGNHLTSLVLENGQMTERLSWLMKTYVSSAVLRLFLDLRWKVCQPLFLSLLSAFWFSIFFNEFFSQSHTCSVFKFPDVLNKIRPWRRCEVKVDILVVPPWCHTLLSIFYSLMVFVLVFEIIVKCSYNYQQWVWICTLRN